MFSFSKMNFKEFFMSVYTVDVYTFINIFLLFILFYLYIYPPGSQESD